MQSPTETRQLLVARSGKDIFTGDFYGTGSKMLIDPGQIAILVQEENEINLKGVTAAQITSRHKRVKIVCASDKVKDAQLNPIAGDVRLDESGFMPIQGITAKYGQAKYGHYSVSYLKPEAPVQADTEYSIIFSIESKRNMREYNAGMDRFVAPFKTPENLDDISNPKAHVLAQIVLQANLMSVVVNPGDTGNREFVALAIATGGGVATGAKSLSTIAKGDEVEVQKGTKKNTRKFYVDDHVAHSLKKFIADNPSLASAQVIPVSADYGRAAADSAVDAIIVVGLPQEEARYDRSIGTDVQVNVSLSNGFRDAKVPTEIYQKVQPPIGDGRRWREVFEEYAALWNNNNEYEGVTTELIKRESHIDPKASYDCFVFSSVRTEWTLTTDQRVEHTVHVLVKTTMTPDGNGGVTRVEAEADTRAALNALVTKLKP